MIVFSYHPDGIVVIRTCYSKGQKSKNIGRLHLLGPNRSWLWDQRLVKLDVYRTLDNSEKRQIIGMLDTLNRAPVRSISDMKRRWEEIIRPSVVRQLEILSDITKER